MADTILLSLIQKTPVRLKFRQGVAFTFELAWLDEDQLPDPVFADMTFLTQIRDEHSSSGNLIVDFSETPDANGNFFERVDVDATLRFTITTAQSLEFIENKLYYFECKMIDADDEVLDSFILSLLPKPDVAV